MISLEKCNSTNAFDLGKIPSTHCILWPKEFLQLQLLVLQQMSEIWTDVHWFDLGKVEPYNYSATLKQIWGRVRDNNSRVYRKELQTAFKSKLTPGAKDETKMTLWSP